MADVVEELGYVGQINVKVAKIITSTGATIDISGMIGNITMYEDIFANTMSGYIIIQDSIDLIHLTFCKFW